MQLTSQFNSAACLLALVGAVAPAGVAAQSTEHQLIVTVLDGDGLPVEGLGPTDFVVREDGAAREVLRADTAGTGRQIAVLVDTSQAAADAIGDFRHGLTEFLEAMHDGNEISLLGFGGPPRILVPSTTSLARLQKGVGDVFGFPGTAAYLLDAMSQAAEGFARRESARPILVALTTEGLDYSNASSGQVLRRVQASGAAVYTLVLRGRSGARADPSLSPSDLRRLEIERNIVLERGPRDSGGDRRDVLTSTAVGHALRKLATELRNQYLVTYSRPDALIPPDGIEVAVTRAGLTARGTPLRAN